MGKTNITHYKRYITKEEILQILNYTKNQPLWHLFFSIMVYLGLRVSEVCRIKYKDIHGNYNLLRVQLSKTHKIKDRIIPEKLQILLKSWIRKNILFNHEYLFYPNNNRSKHRHIQPSTVRWKLLKIRQALNLSDKYFKKYERISSHSFRHFFITESYNLSSDIAIVKEIIGHSKVETTMSYISVLHLLKKEKELVNQISI